MNKPIAWTTDELNTDNWGDTDWQITVTKEKWSDRQKPLYTHPANLTDEEIWKVCLEGGHVDCIADVDWEINGIEELKHQYLRLCKAILRKAQEK